MKKIQLIVSLIILFIISSQINAHHDSPHLRYGIPNFATYEDPILVLTSYGIPLSPIKENLRELSITPAYMKSHETYGDTNMSGSLETLDVSSSTQATWSENEAKGGGVVFSWFQGLGKNWGYSTILSYAHMSGTAFALAEYDNNGNLLRQHDAEEHGDVLQAMAFLVYDPLYDSEKINLPLFFGAGLLFSKNEASLETTVSVSGLSGDPTLKYESKVDSLYYGAILGGSLQFNTGDFRWNPFVAFFIKPNSPEYEINVTNLENNNVIFTSNTFPEEQEPIYPFGGIGIQYRPWEFNFQWIPNFWGLGEDDSGVTLLTFTKTWSWED